MNVPSPVVMIAGTSSKPLSEVRSFPRSPATAAPAITTTPTTATANASFTRRLRMGTSPRGLLPDRTQRSARWFA